MVWRRTKRGTLDVDAYVVTQQRDAGAAVKKGDTALRDIRFECTFARLNACVLSSEKSGSALARIVLYPRSSSGSPPR